MTLDDFAEGLSEYITLVRREMHARWDAWEIDFSKREVHEVVGGLMARQVTLATQLCRNPGIWNSHIAPIIFRSMVDVYITFSWICLDSQDRAQKYILYGLG